MAYTTVTAKLDSQDLIVTSMSTSAAQVLVSMESARMVSIGMTVSAVKGTGEPTAKKRSTMKEVTMFLRPMLHWIIFRATCFEIGFRVRVLIGLLYCSLCCDWPEQMLGWRFNTHLNRIILFVGWLS